MIQMYIVKVGKLFYKNRHLHKSFVVTEDIQDAKWFHTKEQAEIIAKELSGEVRDLVIGGMMEEDDK